VTSFAALDASSLAMLGIGLERIGQAVRPV
jgi:hypothetical protein